MEESDVLLVSAVIVVAGLGVGLLGRILVLFQQLKELLDDFKEVVVTPLLPVPTSPETLEA